MTLLLLKETILVVAVLSIDTGAGGSGSTSLSGCERPNVADDTTHTYSSILHACFNNHIPLLNNFFKE